MIEMNKTCSQCENIYSIFEFRLNKNTRDGLRAHCKYCQDKMNKIRYERDKQQILEKQHSYYSKNWNEIRSRRKIYYFKTKEKNTQRSKEWAKNNKTYLKTYYKEYYNKNKIKKRNYLKWKIETDVNYRMANTLRKRFQRAFKYNAKIGSAVRDLGCTIPEFMKYLESKFQPGMTWNNYGKTGWHIDHIIPLVSFDLTNYEEVKKAVHYTNLQPLWAEENWKKNKRIERRKDND